MLDGHQYAYANAYSEGQSNDLIFIDATLACSSPTPIDELTRWEWVGEADGVAYLASRLRQACGLEPGTAPRTLPFRADSEHPPKIAGKHWLGYTGDPAEALLRSGTNFITVAAFVLAWPVMVPADVICGASDGTSESSADAAAHKVGLRLQAISLPAADTVIAQQLGIPALQFVLPDAQTTVLGYAVDSGRAMYVGVVDGQAVWIHDSYPWLDRLAKRAIKEQRKQRRPGGRRPALPLDARGALLQNALARLLTRARSPRRGVFLTFCRVQSHDAAGRVSLHREHLLQLTPRGAFEHDDAG